MARAKRTHRAEARRRYRSEQAVVDQAADTELDGPVTTPPATTRSSATNATARPSISKAFRAAMRPLDLRSDLRAIPELVRDKALWVPVGLTLLSTVLYIALNRAEQSDPLTVLARFLFTYFVQTPAIGGVFIAGFLAKRASWLYGIVIGLFATACYSFLVVRDLAALPADPATEGQAREAVLAALVLSPVVGALFASSAAWYRRFLYLINPNRGRPRGAPQRPDGRTRTAANHKAGARR